MRRALGLLGESPRHRPEPERTETGHRTGDRFGAPHRRRFVQDGDVPVTVVRREAGHETQAQRVTNPAVPPTSNRLQRAEASLAAEANARKEAERALQDAQAVVRDLQTKIGHAELARNEATETLRRERELIAQLRQETAALRERLHDAEHAHEAAEKALHAALHQLHDEPRPRKSPEKTPKAAEPVRESPAPMARPAPEEPTHVHLWAPPVRKMSESAIMSPALRRRRAAEPTALEQEPVKWWLQEKAGAKRR